MSAPGAETEEWPAGFPLVPIEYPMPDLWVADDERTED